MEAGKLRTYVHIQVPSQVIGELGGRTQTWTTFANAYASIEATGGKESVVSKGVIATTSHKIEIRYVEGVSTKMRVAVFSDDEYLASPLEVYAITSVIDPDRRRRKLVIAATVAEGAQ